MRSARAIAIAASLLIATAATAVGATPQTSMNDVEDEVMCPICGTLLELSEAPQAERERAFIAARIAEGKTKTEIKDELVAEYGPEVLALPEGSGFQLSAYLVPAIAFLIAVVALAIGVRRWRRSEPPGRGRPPSGPEGADAERLDADIARYDL